MTYLLKRLICLTYGTYFATSFSHCQLNRLKMRKCRFLLKRIIYAITLISVFYACINFSRTSFGFDSSPTPFNPSYKDLRCSEVLKKDTVAVKNAKVWEIPSADVITEAHVLRYSSNCSELRQFLQFPIQPLSAVESQFPLAYAYVVHKNFHQAIEVLRAVYWPQNLYCAHVDLGSSAEYFAAFKLLSKCYDNIMVADDRTEVIWGHPSVLDSAMICLKHLYAAHNHPWKYLQILAGNDVPLRTNREMVEIFSIFNGSHDSELTPGQEYRYSYVHHLVNKSFFDSNPKAKGSSYALTDDFYIFRNESDRKSPVPGGLTIYKGAFAVVMSRPLVNFIFESPLARELYEWMKDSGRPQEQFWATLIHDPKAKAPGGFDGKCLKSSKNYSKPFISRYQVWPGEQGRVCRGKYLRASCLYGVDDLPTLNGRPELMAHKVEMTFQPATMYCLLESLYNRTYSDKPLSDFQRSFYESLPSVRHHKAPDMSKKPC